MLRAVIISPDAELADRLTELANRVGGATFVKSIDRYLTGFELERFLRAHGPHVVFLSLQQLRTAIEVIKEIEELMPGVQVVAVDRACDSAVLLDLMHFGIREFLAFPFDGTSFLSAMARLKEILDQRPAKMNATDNIFSFLSSKAGAGASTVALNTALALSRQPDNNVLLMDLDLNSGMIGFMMKLENVYTVYEAAENAAKLDEHLWPQLVASAGKLDILPAGRLDPRIRIDLTQIRQLIAFTRRFYQSICIDLSGNMEKLSIEVMQESKRIFLVSTPEIPSLHLARQKFRLLQSLELQDRVAVLLNRAQKRPLISHKEIERLVGAPVYREFPNDYRGVHKALTAGKAIDPESELGKQFQSLSHAMLEKVPQPPPAQSKRTFLEFFAVNTPRAVSK